MAPSWKASQPTIPAEPDRTRNERIEDRRVTESDGCIAAMPTKHKIPDEAAL
jgi:hypothetical protein